MADRLIVSPEAAQDIDEAYDWYERRRAGLGEDFLSALDACIQAVCREPEICEKVHEDYRRGSCGDSPMRFSTNMPAVP